MLEGPFYDRESELERLEAQWAQAGACLVTLWGRRRVGKSTLLSRFAEGKRALYVYGTRMAEADVLEAVSLQAARTFEDRHLRSSPFASWESALDYLADRAQAGRLLVVLDEFPYLCEVTPGLDTLVQRWWDQVQPGLNLMLVLAGSGVSFMEGLTGARGPLHGRRTGQVEVHPFDYLDASRFFPQLGPVDRVRAYACFGGVPAYLRHCGGGGSLSELVCRTMLSPGHVPFREAEELLRTEFHQEALYASVLRAVATGESRPSDIARAVGRGSADQIFDHLRRLQELRFLRREVPVTEWSRLRTQRVVYRLADPYLRFWFRYVSPYQSFLQLGRAEEVWRTEIQPTLDELVASTTWEEVCVEHLWRRLRADALELRVAQIGRWWDGREEIDLVGLWRDRAVLVGECKWTRQPVDEGVYQRLREKAARLPLAEAPLWVLASRSGFTRDLRERAAGERVLLLGVEELFVGPGP